MTNADVRGGLSRARGCLLLVLRLVVGAVAVVLIASLLCSPVAMWAQGDTAITAPSALEVAQLSLGLGVVLSVFVGTLWLLACVLAMVCDS